MTKVSIKNIIALRKPLSKTCTSALPPKKMTLKYEFLGLCNIVAFWLFEWQVVHNRGILVAQRGFSFIDSFRVFLIKNVNYFILLFYIEFCENKVKH